MKRFKLNNKGNVIRIIYSKLITKYQEEYFYYYKNYITNYTNKYSAYAY